MVDSKKYGTTDIPKCNITINDEKYYNDNTDGVNVLSDMTNISSYCSSSLCLVYCLCTIVVFGSLDYYRNKSWNSYNISLLFMCILGLLCCFFSVFKMTELQNDIDQVTKNGRPCIDESNNHIHT